MFLRSLSEIGEIPIGYSWTSKPVQIGFWRFFAYALLFGDWNKVHINPLTAWFYRSNLGGLTCCGDLVTSFTASTIHKVLKFDGDYEVIASSKSSQFKRPLHPWTRFTYEFTLAEKAYTNGKAVCVWQIELRDARGKLLSTTEWGIQYLPVQLSRVGEGFRANMEERSRLPLTCPLP